MYVRIFINTDKRIKNRELFPLHHVLRGGVGWGKVVGGGYGWGDKVWRTGVREV